eukprot:902879-Rhodomonas_salina.1
MCTLLPKLSDAVFPSPPPFVHANRAWSSVVSVLFSRRALFTSSHMPCEPRPVPPTAPVSFGFLPSGAVFRPLFVFLVSFPSGAMSQPAHGFLIIDLCKPATAICSQNCFTAAA